MTKSTYDCTRELCDDLPTNEVRRRLSCDEGQVRSGNANNRTHERIRAYRDIIADRTAPNADSRRLSTIEHPIEYKVAKKYQNLYESALRRGKTFELTFDDVQMLLEAPQCSYTGVTLQEANYHEAQPHDRTIDRIDPEGGYTATNVVAVSHQANQLKSHLFEYPGGPLRIPLDDLMMMCQTLKSVGFNERSNGGSGDE